MKHSLPMLMLLSALLCAPARGAEAVQATLTLSNGDTLSGTLVSREDGVIVLRHPTLGEIRVPESQITKTAIAAAAPTANPAPPGAEEKQESRRLLEPLLPGWKRQFDLGIAGSAGNSRAQNIHGAVSAKEETPERRWDVQLAYDSAEVDGDRSRNQFFAQANRDWLTPGSPHYYFATGRYDWDQFQDWSQRVNAAGGYGYEFVNRPDWVLRGKIGAGASREFGGADNEITPEGLLGVETQWRFSENNHIELTTTFYPKLNEIGEFRNLSALQWINKLNSTMRLKVGLANEYDSDVGAGVKHNDFKYTTALSWDI